MAKKVSISSLNSFGDLLTELANASLSTSSTPMPFDFSGDAVSAFCNLFDFATKTFNSFAPNTSSPIVRENNRTTNENARQFLSKLEAYSHLLFHAIFASHLGELFIGSEIYPACSDCRVDSIVLSPDNANIYIIEFKAGDSKQSAFDAIEQTLQSGYFEIGVTGTLRFKKATGAPVKELGKRARENVYLVGIKVDFINGVHLSDAKIVKLSDVFETDEQLDLFRKRGRALTNAIKNSVQAKAKSLTSSKATR